MALVVMGLRGRGAYRIWGLGRPDTAHGVLPWLGQAKPSGRLCVDRRKPCALATNALKSPNVFQQGLGQMLLVCPGQVCQRLLEGGARSLHRSGPDSPAARKQDRAYAVGRTQAPLI